MKEISCKELSARLADGSLQLLDVREQDEFDRASLPGAILIPLGQLPQRFAELDPSRETVVYCFSGRRSANAVRILEPKGFAHISNLVGGIQAWLKMAL